jgi:hypothetical protein
MTAATRLSERAQRARQRWRELAAAEDEWVAADRALTAARERQLARLAAAEQRLLAAMAPMPAHRYRRVRAVLEASDYQAAARLPAGDRQHVRATATRVATATRRLDEARDATQAQVETALTRRTRAAREVLRLDPRSGCDPGLDELRAHARELSGQAATITTPHPPTTGEQSTEAVMIAQRRAKPDEVAHD